MAEAAAAMRLVRERTSIPVPEVTIRYLSIWRKEPGTVVS